jgi:Peptidase family S41
MVNEFSASASEIFAAAIQDYKRGIIVGSTATYGKGTVQRPIPLSSNMDPVNLGTVHLTMQKYYRINGASTQLKGGSRHPIAGLLRAIQAQGKRQSQCPGLGRNPPTVLQALEQAA